MKIGLVASILIRENESKVCPKTDAQGDNDWQ